MAIAMSVIYGENAYYYSFPNGATVKVGEDRDADVYIPQIKNAFFVSCKNASVAIEGDAVKRITAQMDEYVVIDQDARLMVFLTEASASKICVPLSADCEVNIGRSNKKMSDGRHNHIVINLPYISSKHFALVRKNGETFVYDSGSKNGLFLNGRRITNAKLQDGDVLSVFTVRILFKENKLHFENVGTYLQLQQIQHVQKRKEAPKQFATANDFLYSRSPRLVTRVVPEIVNLEKPPKADGVPQINWANVIVTPAISIVLMFILVVVTGMNPVMLIMSGVMSVVSAVVAVRNYKKQKQQHENLDELIDKKYHDYLRKISEKLNKAKREQLSSLKAANPSPAECLPIAKNRGRNLWERSIEDEDFLSVRIGTGTISAAVTAKYQQSEFVLAESKLEDDAKKLAAASGYIENAPILCDLAGRKKLGVVGTRGDEIDLVRNMIIGLATAHSYDEMKIVVLFPEQELAEWGWVRWLPHCADDQRKKRYVFSSVEDAKETLDTISDILAKRAGEEDKSYISVDDKKPHYVFVVAASQMIEKHPIRKHLLNNDENGCSVLFIYDRLSSLPKECAEIIDVSFGKGEIYDRFSSATKQAFRLDPYSLENADTFARFLAPLYVNTEGLAASLPASVSFLEGYGVSKPEQLNIAARWKNAKTYKSMAVPIAAVAGGEGFCFDVHRSHHGTHGIVAGMTGSGKTEMVQSWLLSLAVNYSPQDVSFVLIDFKGTALIAPFMEIPHLAGYISDLDTPSDIARNLMALQSEIYRRELLIDKYRDKYIKNINDLNKAYEKGIVPEKLAVLLIVIDEYAAFKKAYPDFGATIDKLTQLGQALGMFVTLMAQKPAGVVSAQTEDNIRYRWCLRVANYSASREMLGRTDAAKISVPGRAYIKVGEDDVYEQVQSFWSGAPYVPNKEKSKKADSVISYVKLDGKKVACEQKSELPAAESNESEIDAVVRYIGNFCELNQIACAEKIWAEKLPETVSLSNVLKKRFDVENGWPMVQNAAPAVGLVDDPEKQDQYPLTLDFAKLGHVLVYGAPVSGKTTFLQTLIMSIALSCSPDAANVYAMDFGGWSLNILQDLPHVGGIANDNEPERIKKMVALLTDILDTRKTKFAAAGVGNITSYRDATGERVPDIIVVVDNFGSALKLYPELDTFFGLLTGSGANYGIYLVATALATNAVPIKIAQNVKHALALQMIEKSDYTYTVGKVNSDLPAIAGRGYAKGKPPLMFQTALPAPGANEKEMAGNIRKTAVTMNKRWIGDRASGIPELPAVIPYGSVKTDGICLGLSTDKVVPISVDFSLQHFLMLSGMPQSGKTSLLCTITKQLKEATNGKVYAFDVTGRIPEEFRSVADTYLTTASEIDAFIESIRPELQQRLEKKKTDPNAAFATIIFAIDNYSQFFEKVSNESVARLLAIIKLGKELSLRLIVSSDAYDLTSLVNKGEAAALSMARGDVSVMLGGSMNDHASITTKTAYAQKSIIVNEHEGYFVQKMNCTRFKAMNSVGE